MKKHKFTNFISNSANTSFKKEFGKEVWDLRTNWQVSPVEEPPKVVNVNLEDDFSSMNGSVEKSLERSRMNLMEMNDQSMKDFESNAKTL